MLSITELNSKVQGVLRSSADVNDIWVEGEISNLTKHRSGHYYLTLKDKGSEVRCTLFRGSRAGISFEPEESMMVQARGSVDIYIPRGSYQFNIRDMRPRGIGDLYRAFEALKEKLKEEGLFDEALKRPIPSYPRRVGVVTSPTGAAIRDVLNVLARRFPVDVLLSPALVQGEGAKDSIIQALHLLEKRDVDVIIIGRGGGSIEDLWPFNEEDVARAIRSSKVPAISAVGHETDFTISDFVADLRAPTPSAAAELAVPDREVEGRRLNDLDQRKRIALVRVLDINRQGLMAAERMLTPRRMMDHIERRQQRIDETSARIRVSARVISRLKRAKLDTCSSRLEALSPLRTLDRGYVMMTDMGGAPLTSVTLVTPGMSVRMRMRDGHIDATVDRTWGNDNEK